MQIGNQGYEQRPCRHPFGLLGTDLFGGEAMRGLPGLGQHTIPDTAKAKAKHTCQQYRPKVDLRESHGSTPVNIQFKLNRYALLSLDQV